MRLLSSQCVILNLSIEKTTTTTITTLKLSAIGRSPKFLLVLDVSSNWRQTFCTSVEYLLEPEVNNAFIDFIFCTDQFSTPFFSLFNGFFYKKNGISGICYKNLTVYFYVNLVPAWHHVILSFGLSNTFTSRWFYQVRWTIYVSRKKTSLLKFFLKNGFMTIIILPNYKVVFILNESRLRTLPLQIHFKCVIK